MRPGARRLPRPVSQPFPALEALRDPQALSGAYSLQLISAGPRLSGMVRPQADLYRNILNDATRYLLASLQAMIIKVAECQICQIRGWEPYHRSAGMIGH